MNNYWAYITREVNKSDLGHTCKECKLPFASLKEKIAILRGGRIQLKYHINCFSGDADPRTQKNSTYNKSIWVGYQSKQAPQQKYNKMRTDSHF